MTSVTLRRPRVRTRPTLAEAPALVAASGQPIGRWRGVLTTEGKWTGDHRFFKAGATRWEPDEPAGMPLRWAEEDYGAHQGARHVGWIEGAERLDNGDISAWGSYFDPDFGAYIERAGKVGLSVDCDEEVFEVHAPEADGLPPKLEFSDARIRGVTAVDIPAFVTGYLEPEAVKTAEDASGDESAVASAFAASESVASSGADSDDQLTHAGVLLVAEDTGRWLMLQRALDEDDDNAGLWEFPGGGIEEGESPLEAAHREFGEEVGVPIPEGEPIGAVDTRSGNYRLFVQMTPEESDVDIDGRELLNPDDPDGDVTEALAWWDPEHVTPGGYHIRPEVQATDWGAVDAVLNGEDEASMTEFGKHGGAQNQYDKGGSGAGGGGGFSESGPAADKASSKAQKATDEAMSAGSKVKSGIATNRQQVDEAKGKIDSAKKQNTEAAKKSSKAASDAKAAGKDDEEYNALADHHKNANEKLDALKSDLDKIPLRSESKAAAGISSFGKHGGAQNQYDKGGAGGGGGSEDQTLKSHGVETSRSANRASDVADNATVDAHKTPTKENYRKTETAHKKAIRENKAAVTANKKRGSDDGDAAVKEHKRAVEHHESALGDLSGSARKNGISLSTSGGLTMATETAAPDDAAEAEGLSEADQTLVSEVKSFLGENPDSVLADALKNIVDVAEVDATTPAEQQAAPEMSFAAGDVPVDDAPPTEPSEPSEPTDAEKEVLGWLRANDDDILKQIESVNGGETPGVSEYLAALSSAIEADKELLDGILAPAPVANEGDALIASVAPVAPPDEWFEPMEFDGPQPMTITADGRVYGHLATWGSCHASEGFRRQGQCVEPPSDPDAPMFHLGQVITASGKSVDVGRLTVGGGHADLRLGLAAALEHYDDASSIVAAVKVHEDAWGIGLFGSVIPGATPEQVASLRLAPLSGDWRKERGQYRLVAAHAVVVPGYPVPRTLVASVSPGAFVTAGRVEICDECGEEIKSEGLVAASVFRQKMRTEIDAGVDELRGKLRQVLASTSA